MRYFGTDGIRGLAYQSPLTLREATRWGAAWAQVARLSGVQRLVVGWDSRESSEPLYHAFRSGVSMTLEVVRLGLAPTPAVAWTVAESERSGIPAWGLMVSASHNPAPDNGLKGFNGKGEKLEEEEELAIEEAFEALQEPTTILADTSEGDLRPWLAHLGGIDLPAEFKLVVDCAHGATGPSARALIRGAGVSWLAQEPDGARINDGVGSTHLEALRREVLAKGADLGLAFDGDGDRCLALDAAGALVDGDQMLWLLVQDRIAAGDPPAGVVGTLMTNGGLSQALQEAGIPFVRTAVGDKYLLREMGARGWDLAAEASGHLIQKRIGPSGDGLAAALSLLRALLHRPKAERFSWTFRPWPQRLVNVVARERRPVEACPSLSASLGSLAQRWGDAARIVVRWSGTEPKLRLMVEARESAMVDEALQTLESAVRRDLGLGPVHE